MAKKSFLGSLFEYTSDDKKKETPTSENKETKSEVKSSLLSPITPSVQTSQIINKYTEILEGMLNEKVEKPTNSLFTNDKTPVENKFKNIINLENVTHQWEGASSPIFENFTLNIEDNPHESQFISIMGQSGCGKSTILNMIAGLIEPDKGKIKINEKELVIDQSIPMIFQHYSSYPWRNVLKNVELPLELKGINKKEIRERSIEMLKIVGLEEHLYKYPNQLSGGQQQRVAIARSLNCKSDILLLDEATSGLDIKMKRELQDILVDLCYNKNVDRTFVNVGHNIEENVYMSNKIIILTANPCTIYKIIDINFSNRIPSIRKSTKFHEYVDHIDEIMTDICK